MSDSAGLGLWMAGARPRTLVAAVVPVAVGTSVAVGHEGGSVEWWRAGVALLVAAALQIGVNFANDYSDGVRGTDDERRVGPRRLVGSGLVEPGTVKRAALLSFAVAGVAGLGLAAVVGWELLVVGAACLLAGWTYTGGPRPYGYLGLGEVFVFVFFGLVATVGTTYVLTEELSGLALMCSVSVGLWATALLVVNNLRDIPGDTAAGKRTLAVRFGDRMTRRVYLAMLVASYVASVVASFGGRAAVGAMVGVPLAIVAVREVAGGAKGSQLIGVLATTGRVELISGLGMTVGLAVTG
jgi:1,4-dihydroxy-2-naphthoate octaprenyltransferase